MVGGAGNPFAESGEGNDAFERLTARAFPKQVLPQLADITRDPFPVGTGGPVEGPIRQLAAGLTSGFGDSPISSLVNYGMMRRAIGWEVDAGYDIFGDRRIADAGLSNQMHLFYGSQSRDQTQWILDRTLQMQREADYAQRAGTLGQVGQFLGGILGDPMTYLPATLGTKGATLAWRARTGLITGAEMKEIGVVRSLFGSMADSVRNMGVTGAMMVAENALQAGFDPNHSVDMHLSDFYVPMALAGSVGFLSGSFERANARAFMRDVQRPGFLHGTPPSGARYVPDDFTGPVIPPDRELAAGLVSRYDEGSRRMESRSNGRQADMPYNGHDVSGPGSLATNYGAIRTEEALLDPTTRAILDREGVGYTAAPGTPRTMVNSIKAGPGARTVRVTDNIDPETHGSSSIRVGGQSRNAAEFDEGHRLVTPNGDSWVVARDAQGAKRFYREGQLSVLDAEGKAQPFDATPAGSVGAALSPASQLYQEQVLLAQGRMAPTGIGLENLPMDPVSRTFRGMSVAAMQHMASLVSTGGRLTVGNLQGLANLNPIEQVIAANWTRPVVDLLRSQHDSWAEYRAAVARAGGQVDPGAISYTGRSDMARLLGEVGTAIKDRFARGEPGMSMVEFRNRVGEALRNGDKDLLDDAATPYINREAAKQRGFYNDVKDKAVEGRLFEQAYTDALHEARGPIDQIKKEADEIKRRSAFERWDPARTRQAEEALLVRLEDAEYVYKLREDKLKELRANGPSLNGTAPSYRPRMWDAIALRDGEQQFIGTAVDWLKSEYMKHGATIDTPEAARIAKEMHSTLSRQNPIFERGDVDRLFKWWPSRLGHGPHLHHPRRAGEGLPGLRQRDSAALPRQADGHRHRDEEPLRQPRPGRAGRRGRAGVPGADHRRQQGLRRADRGSQAADRHDERLDRRPAGGARQALRHLRRRRRPVALGLRLIRMAKQFSNVTLLGMSGVSSLGDMVRPLMTEGLDAMYGYGLRSLMADTRGTILRMAKTDLEHAGVAMDLMQGMRA